MKSRTNIATPAEVPPRSVAAAGAHRDLHPLVLAHAEAPGTPDCRTQVSCAKTTWAFVVIKRFFSVLQPVALTVSITSWNGSFPWER